MKKNKQDYESPITEVLVVRFEGNILTVSGGTEQGDIVSGPAWS